jgi:hypothetical protein
MIKNTQKRAHTQRFHKSKVNSDQPQGRFSFTVLKEDYMYVLLNNKGTAQRKNKINKDKRA